MRADESAFFSFAALDDSASGIVHRHAVAIVSAQQYNE
jgi:hypothetical protein